MEAEVMARMPRQSPTLTSTGDNNNHGDDLGLHKFSEKEKEED